MTRVSASIDVPANAVNEFFQLGQKFRVVARKVVQDEDDPMLYRVDLTLEKTPPEDDASTNRIDPL